MLPNDETLIGRPQHNQLWETVLTSLRSAIIKGKLASGTHLVETDLARRLNVSRGPVRDALIRLEREGLVVHQPYRGKFVAELSANYIHESYSLRLLLESFAVELAIEKLQAPQFAYMQRLVEQMALELKAAHFEAFADIDIEFHRQLIAAAEHKQLLQMWEMLTNVIHAFIAINVSERPDMSQTMIEGHAAILRALAARTPEQAKTALRLHLAEAETNILSMINQAPTKHE